jgi:hypothetical protein
MRTRFKEVEHLMELAEIAFPDMPEGKKEILKLVLSKAYEAGQAYQIKQFMAEQRRMRTELAMLRVAKWKVEKQLNN